MEIKSLKEIASLIRTGKTPPTKEEKYFNGEINWYSPGDLDKAKYLFNAKRTITQQAIEDKKAITFPKDTLLVGCIGDIGKLGITSELSSSNQQLTGILPNDETNVSYLYYWFKGNKKVLENHSNNAVVPILNNRTLETVKIGLPPLDQQKKIAAILDAADAYRQKTKALIEKYDELTQSLFLDMFEGMEYHTISELIEKNIITIHKDGNYGGMYPRKNEFGEDGIPFLSAKHIAENGSFDLSDVPLLNNQKANKLSFGWIEKGDVLLSHNASVGKVAFYNGQYEKALIGTSLTCFRTNKKLLNPRFLTFAFRGKNFQSQLKQNMGQTTRNQVPITAQKKLTLPLPNIQLQNQFAERVQAIGAQKAQAEASLALAEDLFNSLLQRAFNGELTS